MVRRLPVILLVAAIIGAAIFLATYRENGTFPEKKYSCQYLLGRKCAFVSVKGLDEDSRLIDSLRLTPFPVIGRVNAWLYPLEYALGHRLDAGDIRDILGTDFTVQYKPFFLLITRARMEMNLFYYVRPRADPEIKYKSFTIHSKTISQVDRTLYYIFISGYLLVSDDLKQLKSLLMHPSPAAGFEAPGKSKFVIWDSIGASGLGMFFRTKPICVYGESPDAMRLYKPSAQENGTSDPSAKCVFNLDLNLLAPSLFPAWGKFIVHDFLVMKDRVKAADRLQVDYALLVPVRTPKNILNRMESKISSMFNAPSEPLTESQTSGWIVRGNTSYVPILEHDGVLLSMDLTQAVSWKFVDPALAVLLSRYGRITVRPGR